MDSQRERGTGRGTYTTKESEGSQQTRRSPTSHSVDKEQAKGSWDLFRAVLQHPFGSFSGSYDIICLSLVVKHTDLLAIRVATSSETCYSNIFRALPHIFQRSFLSLGHKQFLIQPDGLHCVQQTWAIRILRGIAPIDHQQLSAFCIVASVLRDRPCSCLHSGHTWYSSGARERCQL